MMNAGEISTAAATATLDDAVAWSPAELAIRARRTRWAGRFSAAAPLAGIAAGAWLALGPRRRAVGLGTIGASLSLALVRWQLQRWVTEQVPYELQATLGDIELRSYPDQVYAETTVGGVSWELALGKGFERLAGYIFGGNQRSEASWGAKENADAAGENLSMTAPVLATVAGSDGRECRDYTVSFVMPMDRTLAELPAPLDSRIRLREVPARIVAVLPFRGNYKTALPLDKSEELLSRLHEAGMPTRGDVWFAGYDPPSTLPALRRNEVLVELEPA